MNSTNSHYVAIYVGSMVLVGGNIGSLLNIILFFHFRSLKTNSCSIYLLLASSISDLVQLNSVLTLRILADGFNYDLVSRYVFVCKVRNYIAQLTSMSTHTFISLASIERYLLTLSGPVRKTNTFLFITITVIFWTVISVTQLIFSEVYRVNDRKQCGPRNGPYSVYFILFGILIFTLTPLGLMSIFGYLTLRHVQKIAKYTKKYITIKIGKRIEKVDEHLTRMLLMQIILTVLSTIPFTIDHTYSVLTMNTFKSRKRLKLEKLFSLLAKLLFHIHSCADFYVYLFTSSMFRKQFQRLMKSLPIIKHYTIQRRFKSIKQIKQYA
ncbi:unnamed protein product [Didymodactylos carnosus]|uniref:G-protein coupled receptors family 1 profile domain-containing protein n=1 Tax=Didymodactylos carnosus TaxID=1234261 RepID=A0A816BK99_9BILA|nr:unnamed protein product [Didymodactylos carnosus]CAF4490435.1 unnamed protein product [Didymodactylos carnosus]